MLRRLYRHRHTTPQRGKALPLGAHDAFHISTFLGFPVILAHATKLARDYRSRAPAEGAA